MFVSTVIIAAGKGWIGKLGWVGDRCGAGQEPGGSNDKLVTTDQTARQMMRSAAGGAWGGVAATLRAICAAREISRDNGERRMLLGRCSLRLR